MKKIFLTLIFFLLGIGYFSDAFTREDPKKKLRLKKPDIMDYVWVRSNNWAYVMNNNGSYMYDYPDTDHNGNNAGGEFPRGTGNTIVYAAGMWVGTYKNGRAVVTSSPYGNEFQPGRITNSGNVFQSDRKSVV